MDEMLQKVQNANTHPLERKVTRAQQSVSSRVSSRGQAHSNSGVVVDVAAFKVCHSVEIDIDATTTLRDARVRSSFIGAMDEMSQKVQNASTHPLGRKHHEHAHSSWSVQGSVQGGDG